LVHFHHAKHAFSVVFFRLDSGKEPVRNWLKEMFPEDRKTIGEDIKTLQFGWPIGMPLSRKMDNNLWELRSSICTGIARIFFTILKNQIVLLHGLVKKTKKTRPRSYLWQSADYLN